MTILKAADVELVTAYSVPPGDGDAKKTPMQKAAIELGQKMGEGIAAGVTPSVTGQEGM